MEVVELLGYIGALLVGIVLGLIGGGGSILTVPIIVYLFGLNPLIATAYSLIVVGITSVIGAIQNLKKGMVDVRTATVFAIPSFIAVYITRSYIVPRLPEVLYSIGKFEVTNTVFIMILFAVVMFFAGFAMIKNTTKQKEKFNPKEDITYNYPLIAIEGILVGILTGIVGAGGGFLIIPALVLLVKIPMKKAIGTSLLIIAVKSLIGFLGDVSNPELDWLFLIIFTGLSIIGIVIGVYLSKFISGEKLKKSFGYFTINMALYIIYKELF